jgi:hypothetical protein
MPRRNSLPADQTPAKDISIESAVALEAGTMQIIDLIHLFEPLSIVQVKF